MQVILINCSILTLSTETTCCWQNLPHLGQFVRTAVLFFQALCRLLCRIFQSSDQFRSLAAEKIDPNFPHKKRTQTKLYKSSQLHFWEPLNPSLRSLPSGLQKGLFPSRRYLSTLAAFVFRSRTKKAREKKQECNSEKGRRERRPRDRPSVREKSKSRGRRTVLRFAVEKRKWWRKVRKRPAKNWRPKNHFFRWVLSPPFVMGVSERRTFREGG